TFGKSVVVKVSTYYEPSRLSKHHAAEIGGARTNRLGSLYLSPGLSRQMRKRCLLLDISFSAN
ncbi:MAG TPA: hypothetical protein PLJ78_09365, partial [Anaerolineae bacterium]|nr:hypothetical protein [Anaerolineae bacterium]HQK14136.1 hypothetical protein [Anaerolineae bacterium]